MASVFLVVYGVTANQRQCSSVALVGISLPNVSV